MLCFFLQLKVVLFLSMPLNSRWTREKLNYVERVDVVWDVRQQDTSVKLAGSSRGTGTKTTVRPSAKIPNWQKFLRVGDRLSELQGLISNHIQKYKKDAKILVTTRADSAVSNVIGFNNTHLSPCTHEKADYRIILHISDTTRCGCSKIKVVTSDTDVVIICLAYYNLINDKNFG